MNIATFNERLLTLMKIKGRELTMARVDHALGLPTTTTSFDDPRVASYSRLIVLKGADKPLVLQLSFSETFSPPIRSRPARFHGSLRPTLIDPQHRGELRLQIQWLGPATEQSEFGHCLPIARFSQAARANGWRRRQDEYIHFSHGGMSIQGHWTKASLSANLDISDDRNCVRDFLINRKADREEPPITSTELSKPELR